MTHDRPGIHDEDPVLMASALAVQGNEITEYVIYSKLAERTRDPHNQSVIKKIAEDELRHYQIWKSITGREIKPDAIRVRWYVLISTFFGLSFGLKLMEKGEGVAKDAYTRLMVKFAQIGILLEDEQRHEKDILDLLEEERLAYAGSVVLGLNDALVELTGALAGLTLALQNGKVIAIIGLVTGIAASMSMAASGYLSSREEKVDEKNPLKSALYTGVAYILTVSLLISPYLLFSNLYLSLLLMLAIAILIIAGYTFYITTAKGQAFWARFREMTAISLAVALISFGIGWVIRSTFGIDL